MRSILGVAQTTFERGVASMAAVHMERAISQLEAQRRPIPEAVSRAKRSRAKVIDIGGDVASSLEAGSDEGVTAHLQAVAKAIEAATFTNDADRGAVAQMLFNLEWTLQVAIEEVLAQRRGSAALMQTRRTGRQLWGQLRSTHRVKGLLRRVRDARGDGELLGGEASRGWAEGSVSAWLRRISGRAAGTGPADTELQSPPSQDPKQIA